MTGLITKVIVCPIAVILSGWIFPNVDFANLLQPIVLGLIVAVVGHLMEVMMLTEDTVWTSTIADFVAATVIVYFGAWLFDVIEVTFFGAVLTAVVLGIGEHIQHRWLTNSGRTEKSPAPQ
ncbi:DUF2512 family protein [Tuberibacillus sp. Marseille-P3662]|uniref:DUF2512 family protein n=1 Tax=Tuberibacillus sp. Marseille-P3662 TaxID=1965358 RepID=UPI000A1C8BDF|nr:DUF2512 family protein [Tuberibacillus sp. Marseille-P3662]